MRPFTVGSQRAFEQIIDTVVVEGTALAVSSLDEAEMIQKYSFTILLHAIQCTKPMYHPSVDK